MARLETGQQSLQQGQKELWQAQKDLQQAQKELWQAQKDLQRGHKDLHQGQRDIMARIDRLQDTVTSMQSDIAVNLGAAQHVERREENTREEVRALTNLVYAMERQIQHLQTEVRDLRGGS